MEKIILDDTFKPVERIISRREKIIRYYHPWKAIFFMCLPTILMTIIMSTYAIIDKFLALQFADQYIVDQFLKDRLDLIGKTPQELIDIAKGIINAATQYSASTVTLLTAISLFVALGTSTRFGIAYGKQDDLLMRKNIGNGIILIIFLTIIFTPSLIFSNRGIITLQATGSENPLYDIVIDNATNYSKWFVYSTGLILLSNFMISLLRTEGRGFWAIFIILTSAAINITLDIIFMRVLNLGLEGAAIATVISWGWNIIFVAIIIVFDRSSKLRLRWADFKIEWEIMWAIIAIGLTPLVMNISITITSVLSNLFVSELSNKLPIEIKTGVPWIIQLFAGIAPWIALTDAPVIGVSQGSRALLSYAYGAGKYQRIWEIIKRVFIIQLTLLIIAVIIIAIWGDKMLTLFIPTIGDNYRWYFLLSYITYPAIVVPYMGMLFYQSISRPKAALFYTLLRSILVFVPTVTIGYFLALKTQNPMFYFLFLGLVPLFSALIAAPLLFLVWRKYRKYLDKK